VGRCADRHDHAWIVAPESGGALAQLCDVVAPSRWLGCTLSAIVLTGSKRATARHLTRFGIAATQPWEPTAKVDSSSDTWVVKPDDGAGATATRVHHSIAAAAADYRVRLARKQPAVLEPWVEGEALSLSLLCAGGSAELLSINRQIIEVDRDGRLAYRGVSINVIERSSWQGRELLRLTRRVITAVPGLRGLVGIDVVWRPNVGPVVIEINPRLTSAYVGLSASLGRNLAGDVLHIFACKTGRFFSATSGMAH
jgi:predicted ATP-grasp superfamily ATP-dependent carboligase